MPRVLQDWTCGTVRFCLTYESCYSISYCQTGMFQPGELKRLVLAFTHPLTPFIYLFPTCHSSSHLHSSLSAQKQARSHTFATPSGLLLYGRQRDMTGSVAAGKEREGRDEEKKKGKYSYVNHKDWNSGIWFFWLYFLLEKLCHISGERHGVRQLPAGPCRLKQPQECPQAAPGLRAQTRWCNSSVFIFLVINKGNTTDRRLLLPIPPDLFRILPRSRIWLSSWVFLGIIQGSSKAQTESSFPLHNTRKDYLIGGEKKGKKTAAKQCHNNVFDLLKIRTVFFIHFYSNIFT